MIVIDGNLLIYSYDVSSTDHGKSVKWLHAVLSGAEVIGLPWLTVLAFIRAVTNRGLAGMRVTSRDALGAVEEWLQSSNVRVLLPGDQHWSVFRRTVVEGENSVCL